MSPRRRRTAPGGPALEAAKRAVEHALWTRVRVQRRLERRRAAPRPRPPCWTPAAPATPRCCPGCGCTDLVGTNLEFGADVRRDGVLFRHGDITASDFPDGRFDAVTYMSVIEHGVPVPAFLAESARFLRPGGTLVVSADYDQDPDPAASSHSAYGAPVHIFSPDEVREFVAEAARHGLRLNGELRLAHPERPVHWKRTGLDYTFLRLAFVRD